MMEFINTHFATIAILIGTLGGAAIGGLIPLLIQIKVENRKLKRERYLKTLHIYNRFLEANGRTFLAGKLEPPVFQHELYMKEIRGILYEDLSCLHRDVYYFVREIDYRLNEIEKTNNEVYKITALESVYGLYLRMYSAIERHFYKSSFNS